MRTKKIQRVPTYLKHQPIYIVNDYDKIDGLHKNNTDVIGLSIGKAQWCSSEFEPSVKVWRDVKQKDGTFKISRESEETTFTRALDMANFVLRIYQKYKTGNIENNDFVNSVFGNLIIEKANGNLEKELEKHMGENMIGIESHIELLIKIIDQIKKEK